MQICCSASIVASYNVGRTTNVNPLCSSLNLLIRVYTFNLQYKPSQRRNLPIFFLFCIYTVTFILSVSICIDCLLQLYFQGINFEEKNVIYLALNI